MRTKVLLATMLLAAPLLAGCSTELQTFTTGECLNFNGELAASDEEVGSQLPVVDCADAHDGEVFHVADLTDETFVESTIATEVDTICYEAYEAYVGKSYEESTLFYTTIFPSMDTWAAGDRQVACIVTAETGQLTGSVKGSGQ